MLFKKFRIFLLCIYEILRSILRSHLKGRFYTSLRCKHSPAENDLGFLWASPGISAEIHPQLMWCWCGLRWTIAKAVGFRSKLNDMEAQQGITADKNSCNFSCDCRLAVNLQLQTLGLIWTTTNSQLCKHQKWNRACEAPFDIAQGYNSFP